MDWTTENETLPKIREIKEEIAEKTRTDHTERTVTKAVFKRFLHICVLAAVAEALWNFNSPSVYYESP